MTRRILMLTWKVATRTRSRMHRMLDLRRFLYSSIGVGTFVSPLAMIPYPPCVGLGSYSMVLEYSALVAECGRITIGDRTTVGPFARVTAIGGSVTLGSDCTVQHFAMISGSTAGVEIGNGVRIGAHALIIGSNHRFDRTDIPIWQQGSHSKGIRINTGVWIGSNATVLDGVQVGEGAVIAAGAVVAQDVPSNTVVAGVPAHVIKNR